MRRFSGDPIGAAKVANDALTELKLELDAFYFSNRLLQLGLIADSFKEWFFTEKLSTFGAAAFDVLTSLRPGGVLVAHDSVENLTSSYYFEALMRLVVVLGTRI